MQVRITRRGDDLGMQIPKDLALQFGLSEGAWVEMDAEGGRIVISVKQRTYPLAGLVAGMSREMLREAFDWGPDRGREVVE